MKVKELIEILKTTGQEKDVAITPTCEESYQDVEDVKEELNAVVIYSA